MSETSIGVSEETKKKLDKAKKYERETYEDVILRLIDLQEDCSLQ